MRMADLNEKKIIIKAPAKINLHLEIIGKRNDGYHELAMHMQSINLSDYLEIEIADKEVCLSTDSIDLEINSDNLIIKAANLLKKFINKKDLGAKINLKKNIPIGAGMAGGSTDAAATLIGLNKLWNLNLNYSDIYKISCELGSDVPFCLKGGSKFCFGRGEILENAKFKGKLGLILLKDPNSLVSTAETYKKYSSSSNQSNMNDLNTKRNNLRTNSFFNSDDFIKNVVIRNDLQQIVEEENQSVKDALSILNSIDDTLAVSMTGSGSTCFAIFNNIETAKNSYKKNICKLENTNFNVWITNFINEGITFL